MHIRPTCRGLPALTLALLLSACGTLAPGAEDGVDAATGDTETARVGGTVAAERVYDDFPPGAPQDCVQITRIDRIEPIGNHTLLFYMRSHDVWRNRLARSCPGVYRETTFLYEVNGSRLCRNDLVYQLDRFGTTFRRGIGCSLGQFDYLTEDQAEALKALR